MKKILLTFDYELFFGDSGSAENCILKPVDRLIEIFSQYEYRATFFVDTMYLLRLKSENQQTQQVYSQIERQLMKLVEMGHRIELHLHPHWIDAVYNKKSKKWIFPNYDNYCVSALPPETIEKICSDGVDLLNNIGRKIEKDYKVIAYRAGGWAIEPFCLIKKALLKNNISIDTSAAFGMKIETALYKIDFYNIPNKEYYKFKDSSLIEDKDGAFYEIPISTYRLNIIEKFKDILIKKIRGEVKHPMFGDGTYMMTSGSKYKKWFFYLNFLFKFKMDYMYSIDSSFYLPRIFKEIRRDKRNVINIIAHPKCLTKNSLEFLSTASKEEWEFINIYQYKNNILL